MAIEIQSLATEMNAAAFPLLRDAAPSAGRYVRGECVKLAQMIATIEEERADGQITDQQAKLLIEMQKSAMRTVLLSAEGLGLLAVEKAINAALDAVKSVVNAAVGHDLL